MSTLRLVHLRSLDEIRNSAAAWDDLWWRAEVTLPTFRAELVAQWLERFAADSAVHVLAVVEDGQWVAALPLVGRRLAKMMPVGATPSCPWSSSGELLLDPAAEVPDVLDRLVAATDQLPWPLLWLDDVAIGEPRWRAWQAAMGRANISAEVRCRYEVARIATDGDWPAYRLSWSRKHRQKMSWAIRHLQRQGDVSHRVLTDLDPDEVAVLMLRGLRVEDRSWKGIAGTSALKTPGMASFFMRQAEQLAQWGQLRLDFLESAGCPIAFAYGMTAKRVYHSYRIGYDPVLARFSPGQLLRAEMLEGFFADDIAAGGHESFDCLGPLTDAQQSWRPTHYTIGRMAVALNRPLGSVLLGAYRLLRPNRAAPIMEPAVLPDVRPVT